MGNDRYNTIIIGAGPAGAAAAYKLAKNNISVLMLERGPFPGSKNMFGGTIYREPTAEIIPAFWEEAPLERPVVSDELWFMDDSSAVKIGFTGLNFAKAPYNKFTALRPKFDKWFAEQAVKKGARLITNTTVKKLVHKSTGRFTKKIDGVVLDNGEQIYSDVVIVAEGALSSFTEEARLRSKIKSNLITLYCKEVLELESEKIEERFSLEKNEGCIIGMIGFPTSGAIGKAAIFTNKDSISLMLGAYLDQIINKGLSPYQLLQRTKDHPLIRRLIQGAKPVEYQAHIIPKSGYKNIPKLYDNGILVVGDAAGMISGRHGTDLAMLTGQYAAETISQAMARNDYSANSLSVYEKKVYSSYFAKDMEASKNSEKYYLEHPDADFLISKALNSASYKFFRVEMMEHKKKVDEIINDFKAMQSPIKTISDVYNGIMHWGVF
jgi:electron transfer flavoprotein-quinone oxidoreductase